MPGEILYWVLNMSIIATVTGFIVVCLGKIKKIPHRFTLVLWLIPFFRLWIPFGISSQYNLMSLLSRFATKTITIFKIESIPFSTTNAIQAVEKYHPITFKVSLLEDLFNIAATVWVIVAAAVLLAFAIVYVTTIRELRSAVLIKDNVYVSEKVLTPGIYGIFRPKIVIPPNVNADDVKYILEHENAHIKNADNFFRVLAFITAALHWYNPFVWIFLKEFISKLELACDERVISKQTDDEKNCYAAALINCAEAKSLIISAFGGAKIKVRIANILSYKKLSLLSGLIFYAFAAIVAYVLLTNAG